MRRLAVNLRHLRLVRGGCRFAWFDGAVDREALAVLALDPGARYELAPLIARLEQGTLSTTRDGRRIRRVEAEPWLFELTLNTTSPRLRLYFVEEGGPAGARALGLLLAPKPTGTVEEQRRRQNADIDRAYARLLRHPERAR
jgi:hypothetical protein